MRRRRGVLLDRLRARIWRGEDHPGWRRGPSSIAVPIRRPTCVAFGGPALDTLFVTSIGGGGDYPVFDDEPDAGRVFALDVGVTGIDEVVFGGDVASRRRSTGASGPRGRRMTSRRAIVVTGAASGIGLAVATRALREGSTVVGLGPRRRRRPRLSTRGRRRQGSRLPTRSASSGRGTAAPSSVG